ncbi:hypothetical protein OHB26_29455 [Nocardia sp. NBC_01503]|uniref:hypothetical protein n=1 Tax=Nocardia sp. NBC_01503 TaxID=2975997 RepID=UPI002E7BA8C7|nr:hypothetical protein [Nocardia sp. NBC_01503]WTL31014.1 hypothetical protein OHB26_29455 [Nocardia sp. NBC_01503]
MLDEPGEVRVRLRFPDGGAVLDYRVAKPIAERLVLELGRHGVSVTVDDEVHAGLAVLPYASLWGDQLGPAWPRSQSSWP